MHDDRVFVREGRRHHRRSYSLTEVRIGVAVLVVLAGIAAWVFWRGGRPDPALFAAAPALADATRKVASGGPLQAGPPPAGPPAAGPLPAGLAPPGWTEGKLAEFDAENLYVKINGRADYYLALACQRLWVLTLTDTTDPTRTIDIEAFDQSSMENALGAYGGERAPAARVELNESGVGHFDRNALFLVRGRYYIRAIGSDEGPAIRAALGEIRSRLERGIPGAELPWSWALFAGQLGLDPGALSYQRENAFSFAFASDIHAARLPGGETELFIAARPSDEAARELAARFTDGFRELGEDGGRKGDVAWSRDRYLGTFSGASARGRFVLGVRGAPDRDTAAAELERLTRALKALPETVRVAAAGHAAGAAPSPAAGSGASSTYE